MPTDITAAVCDGIAVIIPTARMRQLGADAAVLDDIDKTHAQIGGK